MTTRDNNNDELALWDALLNESLDGAASANADESGETVEENDGEYCDPYERVADASLAFEQNWTPEREFSIEETLRIVPEEFRDELFERLLEIDATLSAKNGVLLSEREYLELFPRRVEAVKRVYATALAEPSVAAALRVGRRVGPYKIEEIVGVGGMGVVYKARDERFGRVVALKFLSTQGGDRREERVERFKREIWLMGQTPPGSAFAQAYDCATDGEFDYYIAMEYVDGVTLSRYYRDRDAGDGRRATGPLPWLDAAKLAREVARGLAEIHELGFAHRDVKPENVMLDANGRIRVLDLGLAVWTEERRVNARNSGQSDGTIDDGAVVGTPAYIAPEARRDPECVDQRSDLYSLGGVLLFLLTGTRPIDWFDPAATESPEPFEEFWERREVECPPELVAILTRLLQPTPSRRRQRAVEVVADLDSTIEKYAPERRRARRRKRARRIAGALAAFATLCGVLFYSFVMSAWRDVDEAKRLADAGKPERALGVAMNVKPDRLPTDQARIKFLAFRGELYQKLAKDEYKNDYLRAALQDFEALLRLDALNAEAWERAAELNASLGNFGDAKTIVGRALKLKRLEPRWLLLDGKISVLRGEAILAGDVEGDHDECCNEAIALLDAVLNNGPAYAEKGDDAWNAAVEAETRYWHARAFYRHSGGSGLDGKKRYEDALRELDKALALKDDYLDALALRAKVRLECGRKRDETYLPLAGNDYRRVAELVDDATKKEEYLIQAAQVYERAERWDLCLDVCEETLKAKNSSPWFRLQRCKALVYNDEENVDWREIAADLDAGLPDAMFKEVGSEEFRAEIWALRAWCGWNEAERAKDGETKRAFQREILEAIDEAFEADKDVGEYSFGENTFDLDDLGRVVAIELGDDEKAEFYVQNKLERETREKERTRKRERMTIE